MSLGICYCGAYGGGKHTVSARCKEPKPPALVTDIQRLDARLIDAAYRLKKADEELHRAEVAHREAGEAVDAELARLQSDRQTDSEPKCRDGQLHDYIVARFGNTETCHKCGTQK